MRRQMAEPLDDEDLDLILAVGSQSPRGLDLDEVITALESQSATVPPERTLRRRLQLLHERGLIRVVGRTKNRRYFAHAQSTAAPPPTRDESTDTLIPLSAEGKRVRRAVRQPVTSKRPVGYQGHFLDAYVPGKTWYLSGATRNNLREMGRTADPNRPGHFLMKGTQHAGKGCDVDKYVEFRDR